MTIIYSILFISIILFVFVFSAFKPKPIYIEKKVVIKQKTFTESLLSEGYEKDTINEIAYEMAKNSYKSEDYIFNQNKQVLDEIITTDLYISSSFFYKHCYERMKLKEYTTNDSRYFETELGKYILKQEFIGVAINLIQKDEQKKQSIEIEF